MTDKTIESLGDPTDDSYVSTGSNRQLAQMGPGLAFTVILTFVFKDVTGREIDPLIPVAVLALLTWAGVAGMRLIEKLKGKRIM